MVRKDSKKGRIEKKKKVLVSIISVIVIIAILIVGKIQMDKYRVKSIVHSEEGKAAIENMLKIMDEKALTPEGKIKSYKIDDSYTYKNPMGGVGIKLIINNDNDLTVKTVLNKYPSIGVLERYCTQKVGQNIQLFLFSILNFKVSKFYYF